MSCKVEGCENPATQQRGRYAGLCDLHRAERIEAAKARPVDEPLPNGTPLPRELRHLLLDLVLLDTLDLDQVRLDAARILLAEEKP